jgi:hypothetical protein
LRLARSPKKRGPTPGGARDGACDGREACISILAPDVPIRYHRDGVPLALIFTDQHGAGLEAPLHLGAGLLASGQGVKTAERLRPLSKELRTTFARREPIRFEPQRSAPGKLAEDRRCKSPTG